MAEQTKKKGIRTNVLKFLIQNKVSVRQFNEMSERTRLRDKEDLLKIDCHLNLWKKYKWI